MKSEKKLKRIMCLLGQEYQSAVPRGRPEPINEIVLTLLSEKADEAEALQAFENLDCAFDSWESVRDAKPSRIALAIGSGRTATRRAQKIKVALEHITTIFGDLDLSSLSKLSTDEATKRLLAIPGIEKTSAKCILLGCFQRHVLPVDVHTYRLAIRLGLIPRTVSFEAAHDALDSIIPWNMRRRFHLYAVAHRRERCSEQSPRCDDCQLSKMCLVSLAKLEPRISVRPKPLALELFSGAGGMSLGFSMAGFNIVQAVEKNARAAATFRANHNTTDLVCGDVVEYKPIELAKRVAVRKGDLSVIFGGPPCQGFSESNRRTRTLENPGNHLFQQFFRYVEALQPEWFVLENVAGLKTLAEGAFLEAIIDCAGDLKYNAEWRELNAAEFGVPQSRRRIFVVGNRLGIPISFPRATHGSTSNPFVSVKEAIDDLPLLKVGANKGFLSYKKAKPNSHYQVIMRSSTNCVDGNLVTKNSDLIIERYKHIRQGQNWEAIPDELMDNYLDASRCHTGIYYRLKWQGPSKVIGNFRKNMLIHPSQNRGLSVREAARLQSFPDAYKFVGSIGFQQQQVGDAVPPLLAKAVAMELLSSKVRQTKK